MGLISLFTPQKLYFSFGHEPTELSLADAVAGRAGRVVIGPEGIGRWTPTNMEHEGREVVCDLRFDPLCENTGEVFRKNTAGIYLPAHIVVFRGINPDKIAQALGQFDYVLIPDTRIKNLPSDFRRRVLSYTPPKDPKWVPDSV